MNDMSQVKSEVSLDHINPTPREAELIAQYNKALETVSFVATQRDTLQSQLTQAQAELEACKTSCQLLETGKYGRNELYAQLTQAHKERDEAVAAAVVIVEVLTQYRVALERCVGALSFYADPETYFAIAILPDHPCGEFADDVSDTNTDLGFRHGKKAREAIVEIAKDPTIKEFLLAKFATPLIEKGRK